MKIDNKIIGKDSVSIIEITTSSSLKLVLIPERGLDIGTASYRDINLNYLTKNNICKANENVGFREIFIGGLLTTCGFDNIGPETSDLYGLAPMHGTHTLQATRNLKYDILDDKVVIFGEIYENNKNLLLKRKITIFDNEPVIYINDSVENICNTEQPLLVLYHFNMGYPLLDINSDLHLPSTRITPRDDEALAGLDTVYDIHKGVKGYKEQVFFVDIEKPYASIYNKDLKLKLEISFDKDQLDYFTIWKNLDIEDYVFGLEPGTYHPMGRKHAIDNNKLRIIKAGEVQNFDLTIKIK